MPTEQELRNMRLQAMFTVAQVHQGSNTPASVLCAEADAIYSWVAATPAPGGGEL